MDKIKMKEPFFIIGNPRSGTTLLRLMLNNHGDLIVPPECEFAVWFKDDFTEWEKRESKKVWIDEFIEAVSSARKIETWNINFEKLEEFIHERSLKSYAEAVSLVYIFYATRIIGKSVVRWGDKNNFHIDHIGKTDEMFRYCNFLHIVRDGRDVASSYKKVNQKNINTEYAPNLPSEIRDIAEEWSQNIKSINSSLRKVNSERKYELRYEDLVRGPHIELKKVCNFLGEEFDNKMLKYHRKNKEKKQEPKEFLKWKRKTLEPPSNDRVGVYREDLTQDERHTFNQISAPILEKYDYI
jgi:hypothetical protein